MADLIFKKIFESYFSEPYIVSHHLLTDVKSVSRKKDQILHTALELFANEGYQNTSTSKIARNADVSEELIFRRFQTKDDLLNAIINLANEDIKAFVNRLEQQDDPKKVIETVFAFPPLVSSNRNFWKLQFSLKYQCPRKRKCHGNHELMHTVKGKLEKAFAGLNYENPKMETELMMNIITNLCQANTNSEHGCEQEFVNFIKQKYEV